MAEMTPYSGDTEVISKLGTTPQERGLTTEQFKAKFDEGLNGFVTWFNTVHKTEFEAHIANRNLLHNWDFRNPVNQRGQSSYSVTASGIVSVDRWNIVSDGASVTQLTLNSKSVTVSAGSIAGHIRQDMNNPFSEEATIVFSIRLISGSCTLRVRGSSWVTYGQGAFSSPGIHSVAATIPQGETLLRFQILPDLNSSITFDLVKAEVGSTSTLINDPPADYGEQLALCKRYFRLWKTAEARTAALQEVGLMRLENPTLGTINIGGTTYYYASADLH
jgi:hypothetical protein